MTKQSAELQPEARPMAAEDFFDRARARLTLTIPAALIDPMAQGARGDLERAGRVLLDEQHELAVQPVIDEGFRGSAAEGHYIPPSWSRASSLA